MGEIEIAAAHAELSARQLAQGAYGPALESMITALRLAPSVPALWAQFSDLVRYFRFRHPATPVRDLLARALEHPAVDPGDLVLPITSIALSHPKGALAEPLLLSLLADAVIRDAALERLLTDARRRMLDEPLPLEVMIAIAHQCFNTEYVFDETPDERTKVQALGRRLAAGGGSEREYIAYAAYRPLSTLPDVKLEGSLVRRQVLEPRQEQQLGSEIRSAFAAKGPVSAAVRAQYEANPYPRWVRMPRWLPPAEPPAKLPPAPRILVAGCGTGQHAIATALRYPNCTVLAVDFSRASLAYALRKTRELGLESIEYRQADILALGALEERFDLVECSGVLHHLEDPLEGWRILAGLRKPGALMRIGLYSETGRRAVVRARELIAARGFGADADGIRACRAAIRDDPSLAAIVRNEDFYSMSGCRDFLFHVQEHRFTLPQIESMLGELGLRFLGFELPDSGETLGRYRARFGDDVSNLKNWHAFEQEFPDSFARMYQFWVT